MARYKRLETSNDLEELMSTLKEGFPLTKHMFQLTKDIIDKTLEANLYVDQWPEYTTIISQEFTPRLSEFADLRIYTTNKDKIMPLMDEAGLLENTGTWQLIHYILSEDDCKEVLSHLLDALRVHPRTKEKTSTLIFDYAAYDIYDTEIIPTIQLPSEYHMRKIPHDTAGFVAKHWMPAIIEYPLQHRIRFVNDMIDRFILLGVYHHSDHNYPVAWVGQKPGGVMGLSYTFKKHRRQQLNASLSLEVAKFSITRGIRLLTETNATGLESKSVLLGSSFGTSQIIAIY